MQYGAKSTVKNNVGRSALEYLYTNRNMQPRSEFIEKLRVILDSFDFRQACPRRDLRWIDPEDVAPCLEDTALLKLGRNRNLMSSALKELPLQMYTYICMRY